VDYRLSDPHSLLEPRDNLFMARCVGL
jgi:hypothetical protein